MIIRTLALGLVLGLSQAASATAQQVTPSLGEVARMAEAAKATVKKAKKTYTNSDLNPGPNVPLPPPPPASPGFVSSSPVNDVSAEKAVTKNEPKVEGDDGTARPDLPESYWRARAEALRVQFSRVQSTQAQLMKPNDARSKNPSAQAMNDNELAKLQQALDGLRKQWARLEASAGEVKAPTAWLDPRPQQQ